MEPRRAREERSDRLHEVELVENNERPGDRGGVDVVKAARQPIGPREQTTQHLVIRSHNNAPEGKERVVRLLARLELHEPVRIVAESRCERAGLAMNPLREGAKRYSVDEPHRAVHPPIEEEWREDGERLAGAGGSGDDEVLSLRQHLRRPHLIRVRAAPSMTCKELAVRAGVESHRYLQSSHYPPPR